MSAPEHLSEAAKLVWDQVVSAYGPGGERIEGPDLEAYVGQVVTLRDAQKRIAEEGLLVADPKGVPIPHPAVAIEKAAQEQIRTWGNAFKPRRGGR